MKKLQLVAIAFLSLLMVLPTAVEAQNKKKKNQEEVTFSVLIDCISCQKKLEAKLPHEKGVKDFKVDLDNQTIWFLYDSRKTDKETLVKALDKLGYKGEEIKREKEDENKRGGN